MKVARHKRRPGEVRDAILGVLTTRSSPASVSEIEAAVISQLGSVAASSVRSYLRLNLGSLFSQTGRGQYVLRDHVEPFGHEDVAIRDSGRVFQYRSATLFHSDCMRWLAAAEPNSIHAVVTDPPYGLVEYSVREQSKLRAGRGGVWRIPPSFDGAKRAPLPRFTVLSTTDLAALRQFFVTFGRTLLPILRPGANVVVASNPLLSYVVSGALAEAGLERRGELVRLVMTMRGGDRPKAAHEEFDGVSVMPRSMWEPWLLFRKPLDGRVQDSLRRWQTGGFRRPSSEQPFGDVIRSAPTRKTERQLAPHPSLKPQAFLRKVVRAVLPLGEGTILDPFAGSGSTLAAACALGYACVGIEQDAEYFRMATQAVPKLTAFSEGGPTLPF